MLGSWVDLEPDGGCPKSQMAGALRAHSAVVHLTCSRHSLAWHSVYRYSICVFIYFLLCVCVLGVCVNVCLHRGQRQLLGTGSSTLNGLQGSESVQQANAVSIVTYFYQKDEPCFWCPIVFLGQMNVSRVVCTYPLSAGVEH